MERITLNFNGSLLSYQHVVEAGKITVYCCTGMYELEAPEDGSVRDAVLRAVECGVIPACSGKDH